MKVIIKKKKRNTQINNTHTCYIIVIIYTILTIVNVSTYRRYFKGK